MFCDHHQEEVFDMESDEYRARLLKCGAGIDELSTEDRVAVADELTTFFFDTED